MNLDHTSPDVRRIAERLARHNNYVSTGSVSISDGYSVPVWLFYVSEAQQIWAKHTAVHNLLWDGTKAKP